MSVSRVSLLLSLLLSLLITWSSAQDTDLDQAEDYSARLQQFLLQKIKEAESWDEYEEIENKIGRQDLVDNDDDEIEIIDGDITEEVVDDGEDTTEDNDGEASGDAADEAVVLNSAPFRMSSLGSELNADIELQEVSGSPLLTMVCRVTVSEGSDLFSEESCTPQIYLVSGQNCDALGEES